MNQALNTLAVNDVKTTVIKFVEIESIEALSARDFAEGVIAGAAIAAMVLCGGL